MEEIISAADALLVQTKKPIYIYSQNYAKYPEKQNSVVSHIIRNLPGVEIAGETIVDGENMVTVVVKEKEALKVICALEDADMLCGDWL